MSAVALMPGDRVVFEQNGRKLRGIVDPAYMLFPKRRGEEEVLPIIRAINRKPRCALDTIDHKLSAPKVRWIERSRLRKLPGK